MTPFKIIPHIGIVAMADFVYHFTVMGMYTLLFNAFAPFLLSMANKSSPKTKFLLRRYVDAWKFGSGLDYDDHV